MRLRYRVTLVIFAILLVIGFAGAAIMLRVQQQGAIAQFEQSAIGVGTMLLYLMEEDMLTADNDRIQSAVNNAASSSFFDHVAIIANDRQVYASSKVSEIGETRTCTKVELALQTGKAVFFMKEGDAHHQYCTVVPIPNKPECYSCHSADSNILGVIEIDVDRTPLDNQLSDQVMILASIGSITFLAIGVALAFSLRLTIERFLSAAEDDNKGKEALYLTHQLASVGELASGVAHELNNPLTGIIGFSDLLLRKDLPDDARKDVRIINNEAQRCAQIVRNLLTFARRHQPAKQKVDLNSTVQKVLDLRAYEHKARNIEIDTRFTTDLPEVMADGFQLQQVFLNIIINAEYQMIEAHGKGTLTIITEEIDSSVRITFTDDGPGITEENLKHVFDPFFTTKEVGKGTGLGLSVSYGIIAGHDGKLYAESQAGEGATFVIELPVGNKAT